MISILHIFISKLSIVLNFVHLLRGLNNMDLHYQNSPMQDTAIFQGCENENFQLNLFDFFHFCSKHRL